MNKEEWVLSLLFEVGPTLLRFFRKPSAERRNVIQGFWQGSADEFIVKTEELANPFNVVIEALTVGRRKVAGTAILSGQEAIDIPLELIGGFFHDDYLQLTYKSKKHGRMQFGVFMLRISPGGNEMTGHYVGFSPIKEKLVHGTVQLKKQ